MFCKSCLGSHPIPGNAPNWVKQKEVFTLVIEETARPVETPKHSSLRWRSVLVPLAPAPGMRSVEHPPCAAGPGVWGVGGRHFKMPQHSLPIKQQCLSSPKLASGWKFLTGSQCSSRVRSDSFCQLISCFWKGMEPSSSYFATFEDVPAPWAYS